MANGRTTDAAEQKWLMPLVGIALALACWMVAEEVRDRTVRLADELPAQNPQTVRSAAEALARMQARAATARKDRAAIEQALLADEPLPLVETRFVHTLRQRCLAAGVQSCVVKFSGPVSRSSSGPPATGPAGRIPGSAAPGPRAALEDQADAVVSIEDLGLAKARAIVSGSFQTTELLDFAASLRRDTRQHWRINGLVVKANNFELDVELLLREPAATRVASKP